MTAVEGTSPEIKSNKSKQRNRRGVGFSRKKVNANNSGRVYTAISINVKQKSDFPVGKPSKTTNAARALFP